MLLQVVQIFFVLLFFVVFAGLICALADLLLRPTPPMPEFDELFRQIAVGIKEGQKMEKEKMMFIKEWKRKRYPDLIIHLPSNFPEEAKTEFSKFISTLLMESKEAKVEVETVDHYDYSIRLYWRYRINKRSS